MSQLALTDYERAVRQVKSVLAARIKAASQGEIEEIHVVSGPGRSPKQVVRDIESLLEAQFGIRIDHKKISVAQVGGDDDVPAPYEALRPKLVGVSLSTVNAQAEAKVELQAGGQKLEAVAHGPASSHNKLRLFADATLRALSDLTLEGCMLVTEDVTTVRLASHQVALVVITLVSASGEQSLSGCALVRRDEQEAVVKATLDAVNRKLKFLCNILS